MTSKKEEVPPPPPPPPTLPASTSGLVPDGSQAMVQSGGNVPTVGWTGGAVNIQKLNGANFLPWKRQIEIVLKLRGLLSAVRNDVVDEIWDMQATLLLLETMDDSHKLQVQAEPTAKRIMDCLEQQYASASENNRHRLLSEYFAFKKRSTDTMFQHVGRLKELRARLASIGEVMSDNLFQVNLINSLPEEYKDVSLMWNTTPPSLKTNELLINILQEREESRKNTTGEQAAYTVRKPMEAVQTGRRMTAKEIEDKKKSTHCGKCGEKGHWWRECPNPAKNDRKKEEQRERPHFSGNVAETGPELKLKWLADTGATSHMCNQLNWFMEIKLYDKLDKVTVGDGSSVEVLGKGTVLVKTVIDGTVGEGTLSEVLFIPDLTTNLVSVGALAEKGMTTIFLGTRCVVTKNDGEVIVGKKVSSRLYELEMTAVENPKKRALLMKGARSFLEWHKALGHPGEARLNTLLQDEDLGIKVLKEELDQGLDCGECPQGKGKKATHPSKDENEDEAGVVHIDLSGKNKVSFSGYYYFLVCKDEATELCHVYFLKEKSDTLKAIEHLIVDYEQGGGHKITRFRSDNGSEFVNCGIEKLLLKEGIQHITSAPRTPQQNGRIEREMGSLAGMARTLLLASGLPDGLWDEAIRTACYLRNRLPTTRSKLTPFERFYCRKPEIRHLQLFGSQVHIILNWEYRHKFDPRTVEGYMVGYTSRRNTYRVYVPKLGRVVETCDLYWQSHATERPLDASFRESDQSLENQCASIQVCPPIPSTQSNAVTPEQEGCRMNLDPEKERRLKVLEEFFSKINSKQACSTSGTQSGETPQGKRCDSASNHGPQQIISSTPIAIDRNRYELQERSMIKYPDISSIGSGAKQTNATRRDEQIETAQESESIAEREADEVVDPFKGNSIPRSPERELRPRITLTKPFRFLHLTQAIEQRCPSTFTEALEGPDRNNWSRAIYEELEAHQRNQTWVVVERPEEGCTLTTKWVFALKRDAAGKIERYKGRLVARGYKQREGIDYTETFAPVVGINSVRLLLAISAAHALSVVQFDVSSAFLYGEIDEDVYLEPPEGVEIEKGQCLKLKKALYGLKQAPKKWNSKFDEVVKRLGFVPTITDPCVYKIPRQHIMLCVYVDDGLIIGRDKSEIANLLTEMGKSFQIKTINGGNFLGMQIKHNGNSIFLSQQRYIDDMVERYNLNASKAVSSPLADVKQCFNVENMSTEKAGYREKIGSLLYCAVNTRPDVLFPTTLLARFCEEPKKVHQQAATRLIQYLKTNSELGLLFEQTSDDKLTVQVYADADWAGDPRDSKSTTGVVVLLSGSPISFMSRKQTITALSTAAAEMDAAHEGVKHAEWVTGMLDELGVQYHKPSIYIDNQTVVKQLRRNQISTSSKHTRLRFHYIREKLENNDFELKEIETNKQKADFLTKALPGPKLKELTKSCNITTNYSEQRMGKHVSKWACHLALMCLVMHASIGFIEGVKLKRVSPIIWMPTDYRVETGAIEVDLDFAYINICNGIGSDKEEGSEFDSPSRQAYSKLHKQCFDEYTKKIEPWLQELTTCKPESDEKNRYKRVAWFIPILAIIGVIAVVACIVIAAMFVVDTNNMATAAAQRADTLAHSLTSVNSTINELNHVNANTSAALESLANKSENNRKIIDELVNLTPEISWQSARVYHSLQQTSANLKQIVRACRQEKVAMAALGELVDLKNLSTYDEESTFLDHVSTRLVNSTVIYKLQFIATKLSLDTKVYQLRAFDVYKDIKSEPYVATYVGPTYALYNSSANCSLGLDQAELYGKYVFRSCDMKNYRDPKLDQWVKREIGGTMAPQVISVDRFKAVYCIYHNITIDDERISCPYYPILISRNQSFATGNISHISEKMYLKGASILERVQTPVYRAIEVDEDYVEQMHLVNEIKIKNKLIQEQLKKVTVGGPINWEKSGLLSWLLGEWTWSTILTMTSSGITLGSCLCLCCRTYWREGQTNPVPLPIPMPLPMPIHDGGSPTQGPYLELVNHDLERLQREYEGLKAEQDEKLKSSG